MDGKIGTLPQNKIALVQRRKVSTTLKGGSNTFTQHKGYSRLRER